MNLVKLYGVFGDYFYVDTEQLNSGRVLLDIYTSRGNKLRDLAITKKRRDVCFVVHKDNLYASPELAANNYELVFNNFTIAA